MLCGIINNLDRFLDIFDPPLPLPLRTRIDFTPSPFHGFCGGVRWCYPQHIKKNFRGIDCRLCKDFYVEFKIFDKKFRFLQHHLAKLVVLPCNMDNTRPLPGWLLSIFLHIFTGKMVTRRSSITLESLLKYLNRINVV